MAESLLLGTLPVSDPNIQCTGRLMRWKLNVQTFHFGNTCISTAALGLNRNLWFWLITLYVFVYIQNAQPGLNRLSVEFLPMLPETKNSDFLPGSALIKRKHLKAQGHMHFCQVLFLEPWGLWKTTKALEFTGSIEFRQSTIPGKIQEILCAMLFWGLTILNVKCVENVKREW